MVGLPLRAYADGQVDLLNPFTYLKIGGSHEWMSEDRVTLRARFNAFASGPSDGGYCYLTVADGYEVRIEVGSSIAYQFTNENTRFLAPWNSKATGATLHALGSGRRSTVELTLYPGSSLAIRAGGERGELWGIDADSNIVGSPSNHFTNAGVYVEDDNLGAVPSGAFFLTYPYGNPSDFAITTFIFDGRDTTDYSIKVVDWNFNDDFRTGRDSMGDSTGRMNYATGYDRAGRSWTVDFTVQNGRYSIYVDGVLKRENLSASQAEEAARSFVAALVNRGDEDDTEGPDDPLALLRWVAVGVVALVFVYGLAKGLGGRGA